MKVDLENQFIRRTKKGVTTILIRMLWWLPVVLYHLKWNWWGGTIWFCCEIVWRDVKDAEFPGRVRRTTEGQACPVCPQSNKEEKENVEPARATNERRIDFDWFNRVELLLESGRGRMKIQRDNACRRAHCRSLEYGERKIQWSSATCTFPYSFDLFPRVWVTHPVCLPWSTAPKALSLINWEDTVCSC